MKSSTKSSIRNFLVTIVLLGSAGYFGWNFWGELTRTAENIGGTVIGEVVEVRGQAQRRYDRQSRWGSLKGTDQVFNLDSIRTSTESGAVIVLKTLDDKGDERFDDISLGPDTFIILDLSGNSRNINFVGGDLSTSGSEGLMVTAENTSVSVDKGSVNLSRIQGEETSVTVIDGEARVLTGTEQTVLGTESVLRIDESDGSTSREDVVLRPLKPVSNALLLTYGEKRIVDFAWELYADWRKPELEISGSPSFSEAESEVIRVPAGNAATLELSPGVWYWHVRDAETSESGAVNVLTVDRERVVEQTSPVEDPPIPFRGDAPGVSLQWRKAWFADSYDLELSRTASFSEIELNRNLSGSSVLVEDLDAGTWWWRITPLYRRGVLDAPIPVASRSFTLERRIGFDPINLINPPDGSTLDPLDVREGIDFRWQPEGGLIEYRVEVARDEDFGNTVAVSGGEENWSKLLTAPEPGSYYWKVEGISSGGQEVSVSEVRSFKIGEISGNVELLDPAAGEIKELEPYTPFEFLWRSSIPGTVRFQLERFINTETGEKSKIIESLVEGESFTAPLPGEGSYTWKVQILDIDGRILRESPEARFRLRSEFRAPLLIDPRPGSGINLVGSESILFAWEPAPAADAYTALLRAPDGSILGRDDRVVGLERAFPLPPGAGVGNYSMELSSLRDNPPAGAARASEAAIYSFRIEDLVRYTAAIPVSPAEGAAIRELSALRNDVILNWQQDPPLGQWTVELDNGSVTRLYRTNEPRLVLEGLAPGSYSWKVRSSDGLGQQAPDSRISRFSISALPVPTAPIVTSPQSGEVLDMTGARELVFTWLPVEGAEFYDLVLYAEGSVLALMRENGVTGTRFALKDLRILDVGGFVLSIRAGSNFEEVGAVRESPRRRVPFSLTVNIADTAPTILTDELQYAE